MKEIRKNIKEKQFHKVYLLTGDEEYLLVQAKNLLCHALVREGDEMNCIIFENSKIDYQMLSENARTFPFFNDKRVIILDRTGVIKSGKDMFLDILKELPDTTCMIICEPEVDKRSKTYKWIKKNECVREFLKKDQTEKVLLKWIAVLLAKENKKIKESDARYLLDRVGSDMYQISSEVAKLIAYIGASDTITREDIENISSGEVQNKIWDMLSYISGKEKNKALRCYDDLLVLKEPPMRILYLIVRQFRILLIVANMKKEHKSNDQIAREAGIRTFTIGRYESQLRNYSIRDLEYNILSCTQMEEEIKTGRISDQIGLEMLIVGLSDHLRGGDPFF